ncbi:hypothetical protein HWI79_893 [Cryptosporidium felis]|nr:hypothetical protein HWI79_893 [Cryptosporidium felis]
MEEGYDWDRMGSFQIVDGINIPGSSLMEGEILVEPPDSAVGGGVSPDQREFTRQVCSLSQFLVGSEGSDVKGGAQKNYIQQGGGGGGGGDFGLGTQQPLSVMGGGDPQGFGGVQPGLADPGVGIRDGSVYGGYPFVDAESAVSEKELTKRKRSYSGSTGGRLGACSQNSLTGIGRSAGVGGIGNGVNGGSLTKGSGKTRTRKTRDNSEDYGGTNSHSKSAYSASGGDGCSFGQSSSISEDLNSIKYYEGFKLPLGDLGRKMLLKKLREIHTQNPTKMEKALTDHGLSYTRIRFASVQQLFKISYVCDVFDYALSIHCEFGRPRHRDSSKSVQLSSVGSNQSLVSQQPSHSGISSRKGLESQNRGGTEKFESQSGLGAPRSQGAAEDSSSGAGKLDGGELVEAYTPDASPCSHRSYSSAKGNSYSKESGLLSNTPMNKIEHDITSPVSIFSATTGSPSSQKKRRMSSAKSSFSFSPPPIPVTNSPMQGGDSKDLLSLNQELPGYLNNQTMLGYGHVHGSCTTPNPDHQATSGFGPQSEICTGQGIQEQLHQQHSQSLQNGGMGMPFQKKFDEHEPLDSVVPISSHPGGAGVQKTPTRRQKMRARKKGTLSATRNESSIHSSAPFCNSVPNQQGGGGGASNLFGYFDLDEIYSSSMDAEITPFYQPESETAYFGDFEHIHQNQDVIHFSAPSSLQSSSLDLHDQNISLCSPFGPPLDSSSLILTSFLDTDHSSDITSYENPTSLYFYPQPHFSSNFDEYFESSNLNGFLAQGLNSLEILNSNELEVENIDIGCPLISI